ncbi:ferric reductase NAD binding domain-containing protein [Trametes polyzona]|nr:ferric reductase NAD binding domain-containing protein [Trametes polyzona]
MAVTDATLSAARTVAYPHQLWGLIAGFIGTITACRFLSWLSARLLAPSPASIRERRNVEGHGATGSRRFSWGRLPVALVNQYREFFFRNTVDVGARYSFTYAEVFVTIGYMIAIFTWEFVNSTTIAGSALSPTYWSTRAAVLAASQFPLITALGTKNSILAYITGISYDKLNYIHRMAARVVFVSLWTHVGSQMVNLTATAYKTSLPVHLGLMAITAYSVLIVVSYRPIRARLYELFYFPHLFMVLILLLGAYFHAKKLSMFYTYIWPSFLIWALDRFLRLFRIVFYNNYFSASAQCPPSGMDATIELLSPQFVRLRFSRPPQLKWTPGQAAFLSIPSISTLPFEAHPFTIASVDSRYRLRSKSSAKNGANPNAMADWEELEFLINVRDGFTKRLAKAAEKGEKVKAFMDGPYGFSPNLENDDTVVLVAGGSGISLLLSTFLGLVSDVQNGRSCCSRVVLIWSIRDCKQLDWVSKAMGDALQYAPDHLDVSVRIFVTGRARIPEPSLQFQGDDTSYSGSVATTLDGDRPLQSFAAVQIMQGRPELAKLLGQEVSAVAGGRISVTVCGSQEIAKACRNALRVPFSSSLYEGPSVILHVESFGYA